MDEDEAMHQAHQEMDKDASEFIDFEAQSMLKLGGGGGTLGNPKDSVWEDWGTEQGRLGESPPGTLDRILLTKEAKEAG